MTDQLAYEVVRAVSSVASVLLQRNPGPMTLDGTNTWLLRAPSADEVVVVDPGEVDDEHLTRLLAAAPNITLVLLTHGHPDHSGLAEAVHDRTGAPVRALDAGYCRRAAPLRAEDRFDAAGVGLRVLATPGHTADSVSFVLQGGEASGAVLTGDTILGRGTTVVEHPDGNLRDYLDSLQRLRALGELHVLPGHGPELASAAAAAQMYLDHRLERLQQVADALAQLGPQATARQIVEVVYADVDQAVWWAAELSVQAQLEYLTQPPRERSREGPAAAARPEPEAR
jgi:glyoxylase-like metal-dependent hydrolase (beta-lactamase superfamily II)